MTGPKEIVRRETSHGVLIGVAVDDACTSAALPPPERSIADLRAAHARPAFVAGRLALRAALRSHGEALPDAEIDAPIVHDARGAPVLPGGWTGSISHKETIALALARPSRGVHVGVDVEVERPGRIDISRRVLTDAELAELAARPDQSPAARAAFTLQRFSMKEAVYKAIDPIVRRYVGFREVQLEPRGDAWACVFVAQRADEPRLEIEARSEIVDTEIGSILASSALARRV